MRTWLVFLAAIALSAYSASSATADARQAGRVETKVCTLKVSGMTCSGCEAAVRNAARRVDGVKGVKASYEKGIAEVTYDPRKTTPDAIAKVITERSGFKAVPQTESKK